MLDAITDFWKPAKKTQTQEKLNPEQLQVGSTIGFGFVPQAVLSGRRLEVSAVNTYQFGEESLTSFQLAQEESTGGTAPAISMIVAEAEGEHYLAISRRITVGERTRLFTVQDIQNVISKPDVTKLPCRDNTPDFKGWVVGSYRREIQGLKGRLFKGDFRKKPLPAAGEGQEFEYTLLVSESNEHAIEVEQYAEGRMELYTTIYRRMSDIGQISHPAAAENGRPDIKLASAPETSKVTQPTLPTPTISQPRFSGLAKEEEKPAQQPPAPVKPEAAPTAPVEAKAEAKPDSKPEPKPEPMAELKAETKPEPRQEPAADKPAAITTPNKEQANSMATDSIINGASSDMKVPTDAALGSKMFVQSKTTEPYAKKEIRAVSSAAPSSFDAESIECDLRVANKIIDEAIRNEMRLTDIVRRIIELPVAYPESVQIPITLTDEDYALLAIRYGISAADRNAIKRRILEDLNDFSGGTKKAA